MNRRTLDVLEYPRIREEISGCCVSEEGSSALLEREPSVDVVEIDRLKSLSRAWTRSLSGENPPEFRGWPAIRPFLSRLKVEGASLSVEELHALSLFCASVGAFRAWAENRSRSVSSGRRDSLSAVSASIGTPVFADSALVESVLALPDLSVPSSEIARVVDKSGELRDLPELRDIRQGIKKIRQDIERLVGRYLTDESLRNALQSTLPTIRDGREVISLRANFRGRVKGIVHEVSQSGQTIYVEPEDVVDRNNDLVTEEHRLSREVARILRELTARLSPFYGDIVAALDTMVFLDGIGAAARWGHTNRCVFAENPVPQDSPAGNSGSADCGRPRESVLQLRQGRHPLLRERAVPIDLVLSPGGRVLIITGPNTGGKTVSLKTVALFALLNQSGWPIPTSDRTVFPIFDYIGCDIGDEQSLDQSLSTFSAHMKNIAAILAQATERSLVLLDELGSGTDPQEGSAIAMAVLDSLLERGAIVLVTTHHGILKNYGYTHAPCINASVDFDQNTLSPTYRILMGVPGESHALDIASRNGLDASIVAQARSYLDEERADVSALIKGLTAKHEELAQFEEEKKKEETVLREKRRKTDLKELQLKQKELELRESGYRRLDGLLEQSRKQLENLVREIREGEMTREKTLQVKNWIADFEASVTAEQASLSAEREATGAMRKEYDERARKEAAEAAERTPVAAKGKSRRAAAANASVREYLPDLAPGVEVYVGASRTRGTIVRAEKGDRWVVAAGTLKMTVASGELSAVPVNGQAKRVSVEFHADMGTDDVPAFELRLIGMRHDEAVKALERQLDLASMKGLKEFSIVHGKGHGVLQEAVHEMLKVYAGVSDFGFARPEDGGTGKTIVKMK
jgi:DNA mismatch repair protein MutS2